MPTALDQRSTPEQIRDRFDNDVERCSTLSTGQTSTVDAPLAMELITQAAVACTTPIRRVLDIGCGAGNNTIKLRQVLSRDFSVDLLDLSRPMLARAAERVGEINNGAIRTIAGDFREVELESAAYDVVLAATVIYHLRGDADWEAAFEKIYRLLAPGGSVWITDLVSHEVGVVHEMMWARYAEYLCSLGGDEYRDRVLAYVDKEDSPRPVTYQLDLLRKVGFSHVELLHKNVCFAAFGAVKGA